MPAESKKATPKPQKLYDLLGKLDRGEIKRIALPTDVNDAGKVGTWLELHQAGSVPVIMQVSQGTMNHYSQLQQNLFADFVEVTDDMLP